MRKLWAALTAASLVAGASQACAATYYITVDMTTTSGPYIGSGKGSFGPITLQTGDTLWLTGNFLTPLYMRDGVNGPYIFLNVGQYSYVDNGFTHLVYPYYGNFSGETDLPPVWQGDRYAYPATYTGLDPVEITVDTMPGGKGGSFTLSRYSFYAMNIPEPATWGLLLVGLGALGIALRCSRKAVAA